MSKPKGIHATFESSCYKCSGVITVSNGRIDFHECERPVTLADLRAALDNRSKLEGAPYV